MTEFVVSTPAGRLRLRVAAASHVGRVRTVNEDALVAEPPLFAVADGMGGHAFGERASARAIQTLRDRIDAGRLTGTNRVFAAIREANAAVRALTASAEDRKVGEKVGEKVIAGTTLTGVALVQEHPAAVPQWMVFNLGDSRVYRWNGGAGGLEQISLDHSLVQELLDAGLIDEQGARKHPERNVITRALGAADEVHAQAWLLPATHPQTFLICSDGLTKELDDARIGELLASLGAEQRPDAAVDRLLAAALAAGGTDNVSIVLLQAERLVAADASEQDAAAPFGGIDEHTHERRLSPELDDTHPRA
ncbi:MAG: protein phosphatase 2C domain-containing protein [Leifsonia sp.]